MMGVGVVVVVGWRNVCLVTEEYVGLVIDFIESFDLTDEGKWKMVLGLELVDGALDFLQHRLILVELNDERTQIRDYERVECDAEEHPRDS